MPCRHHDRTRSEVGADPRHSETTLSGFKRFDLSTSMLAGSAQHSLPNYELCHETSDSESVPKSGQVQLRGACACSLCLLNHRVHKLSESICNAAPYRACIMIVTAHWHAVTVAVSGTHVRYDRTPVGGYHGDHRAGSRWWGVSLARYCGSIQALIVAARGVHVLVARGWSPAGPGDPPGRARSLMPRCWPGHDAQ